MRSRLIIAGILILVGLVWMGQGSGVIRSSGFMTDDMRWAAIGAVVFVVGALIGGWAVIRRPRA